MFGFTPHKDDELSSYLNEDVEHILSNEIPKPQMGRPFRYSIKPGIYSFDRGGFREGQQPKPEEFRLEGDEMIMFRDDITESVKREIREFWETKEKFEEQGLMHKRGLMLHGDPGTGKTTLIRQIAEDFVKQGNVVMIGRHPWGIVESISTFRKLEATRKLLVIIEDIDEVVRSYGEQAILEFLDGYDSKANVMVIATTNNLKDMSGKLKRPGRFDRKIEIPYPDENARYQYFESKMRGKVSNEDLIKLVENTSKMGFGHLREIALSVYGYGRTIDESLARVKEENQVEPSAKVKEDKEENEVA